MKRSAICSRSTAGRDCRGRDGPGQVEFSLERVVKRNGPPAFIVTQFGWNADNVDELVEVVDRRHVRIEMVEEVLAGIGAARAVGRHGIGGGPRAGAVARTGGGPGSGVAAEQQRGLRAVPAAELADQRVSSVGSLEANPGYRHGALGVQRVVLRHIPEPAEQWLLLERGEVDVARDLTPDLIAVLAGSAEVAVDSHPRGTVIYLGANAGHLILGNRLVVHALRHAVDYHGMADTFLAGQYVVHQAFWPLGLWASYSATPYRLDLARARVLLA